MRKLIGLALLGLAFGFLCVKAEAVATGRPPKAFKTINFSASASLLCKGPGALYSVMTSTAAVSDYVVLRDSNTANTTSTVAVAVSPSATLTQVVTFDPPLQFRNGISLNAPSTSNWEAAAFECGAF